MHTAKKKIIKKTLLFCHHSTFNTNSPLYFVSVHSGYGAEVSHVGEPSVHNQHLVVNDCGQGQPAEYLLQKLQNLFTMHLYTTQKLTVARMKWYTIASMLSSNAMVSFSDTLTLYFARTSLVKPYLETQHH